MQSVHRYMLEHPEEYATGTFTNSWGVGDAATNVNATDISLWDTSNEEQGAQGPHEFTGKAGDVMFMHAYT